MVTAHDERSAMSSLAFSRSGSGAPLVLLHGLGSSRHAWNPVVPLLTDRFDVIAIDLPGFGDSPALADHAEPHPVALAAAVALTLRDLGVDAPHLAGNSLGGWVALELAVRTRVSSITLFSPAGLWCDHAPLYNRMSLTVLRAIARFGGPMLRPLSGSRAARWIMFRQIVGRPTRMSAAQARQAIDDMGLAAASEPRSARRSRAYVAHEPIEAPVAVSFGTRDCLLLPHQSRHVDQLPDHARVLPVQGTGHVPMTDDPRAVAALIGTTARQAGPRDD